MSLDRPPTALAFFLKFPQLGTVKTRLARDIGDKFTLELYEGFIRDLSVKLETLAATSEPAVDVHFFLTPAGKIQDMKALLHRWQVVEFPYHEQVGANLGERMKNTFSELFRCGYENGLLLGSDVPDVPLSLLRDAVVGLRETGSVIGPTADGGYFLVGFRRQRFCEGIFDSRRIRWSTDSVFRQTMEILHQQNIDATVLPWWWDVDCHSDLIRLRERLSSGESDAPHTAKIMNTIVVDTKILDTFSL